MEQTKKQPTKCECKNGKPGCGAMGKINGVFYLCTRDRGHAGDHIACGVVDHRLASWENKEDKQ